MRIKISFDLDLTNTDYEFSKESISFGLDRLNQWFYDFHLMELQRLTKAYGITNDEVKRTLIKKYEENILLSEQLFDNYTMQGNTTDNYEFKFNHQELPYV